MNGPLYRNKCALSFKKKVSVCSIYLKAISSHTLGGHAGYKLQLDSTILSSLKTKLMFIDQVDEVAADRIKY